MWAEHRTFYQENSWAMGCNMPFCIWVKQGSKESTKEHQLQKGIHEAWNKGRSSNSSHTRVSKQLHTSIWTVLVTIPEIFTCGSYFIWQHCDILGKLMRRFMKTQAPENKCGSDLSSIDCKEFKLQLGDKELVIADATMKVHTEVCGLSIGPSIKRILEQWDAICHFVSELNKDPKKVPKSINYKRVYMMHGTKEGVVTRVTLEFLNSCIPVFEQFLLLFQKSSPVVHILYDNIVTFWVSWWEGSWRHRH